MFLCSSSVFIDTEIEMERYAAVHENLRHRNNSIPQSGGSRPWHTNKSGLVTFKMSGNYILAATVNDNKSIGPSRALTPNGF